jgi:FtsP/CotA-like multicopper oxidase with cupredoxin domain
MRRAAVIALALAVASAVASPSASAATREYWVAAVPTTFDLVPNRRDAIMGVDIGTQGTVFPRVVYRRYTRGWRKAIPNGPRETMGHDRIPGPLIRARVGDTVRVHFKNLDTLTRRPHSMHFHAFSYTPDSDGAYLPGFSGKDGAVPVAQSWTYKLKAGPQSEGTWPYHDHSPSMHESIAGGMFGAMSILGRHERRPDREFVVMFAPSGDYQTINGRAFVGNTPVFKGRVGEHVRWHVLAIGSEHHTFHVHGHRWLDPTGRPRDTQTLGPAESFHVDWREDAPGTWFYHCHVEEHMERGMIGIYRVAKR